MEFLYSNKQVFYMEMVIKWISFYSIWFKPDSEKKSDELNDDIPVNMYQRQSERALVYFRHISSIMIGE